MQKVDGSNPLSRSLMKLTDIILKEFNQDLSLPGQTLSSVHKILKRYCGPGDFDQMVDGVGEGSWSYFPDKPVRFSKSKCSELRRELKKFGWDFDEPRYMESGGDEDEDGFRIISVNQTVNWTPVNTSGKVVIHVGSSHFSPEHYLKAGLRPKDDGSRDLKAIYGVLLPKNYSEADLSGVLLGLENWMLSMSRPVFLIDLSKYRLPWYIDQIDEDYFKFPAVLTVSNIPGSCLTFLGKAYELAYGEETWKMFNDEEWQDKHADEFDHWDKVKYKYRRGLAH